MHSGRVPFRSHGRIWVFEALFLEFIGPDAVLDGLYILIDTFKGYYSSHSLNGI